MASELASSGQPLKIEWQGEKHELIIRVRQQNPSIEPQVLGELTANTIRVWLDVWQRIKKDIWTIEGHSPEESLEIARVSLEPLVTVFNKTWDGLSVTVISSDNGQGALDTVAGLNYAVDTIKAKMPQLFNLAPSAKEINDKIQEASETDINDIDGFLHEDKPASKAKQNSAIYKRSDLPFRMFKQIAPTVIQLQEFVQGGGDKYQKSAIYAEQAYHKSNVQYDDGALMFYPITGAVKVKSGNYGVQAEIPTEKGKVWISETTKAGEITVDWKSFQEDFGNKHFASLADGQELDATGCVLVLKMSNSGDKQYKNYYHIYKEYAE